MTARICGTCRHWLTDEREERGVCFPNALTWSANYRTRHGYGPGMADTATWTIEHITDWDHAACGRWRLFKSGEEDGCI